MKKTYKAPLTEVVKINAEQVVCASGDKQVTFGGEFTGEPGAIQSNDDDYDDFDPSLW